MSDHRRLGEGAAESAPTAPHATSGGKPTATARFWNRARLKRVFVGTLLASTAAHYAVVPFHLMPGATVRFNDVDDELTIPVDLFEEAPAPAADKTDDPASLNAGSSGGPGASDASVSKADASALDAGVPDAAPKRDAGGDAAAPVWRPKPRDAGVADGGAEGGVGVALVRDGGLEGGATVAAGPRDPGAMIGMAGLVTAGQVNVTLLVNMQVIRSHPIGAQLGPVFAGIPQWRDFMKGNETKFNPVTGTDWILIYGPSLIHTDRDAVIVKYNAPDEVIDQTLAAIGKANSNVTVPEAGVPEGVTLGHADNGDRAYLRAPGKVLVIVPPDKASTFAKALKAKGVNPRVRPGEALRLVVKDPHRQVSVPQIKFPKELSEMRLWIVPSPDGGADVYGEGDCTSEEAAVTTAEALTQVLARTNSGLVASMTGGLLNGLKVEPEGKGVKLHLAASPDQLKKLLAAVELLTGMGQ